MIVAERAAAFMSEFPEDHVTRHQPRRSINRRSAIGHNGDHRPPGAGAGVGRDLGQLVQAEL
jgi:hypothetical protein